MQATKSSEKASCKLNQHRENEIHFLQTLQRIIQQAKHELNNDLTRMAIKNMPMMLASNNQEQPTLLDYDLGEVTTCQLSVSSINSEQATELATKGEGQELESLDLEI